MRKYERSARTCSFIVTSDHCSPSSTVLTHNALVGAQQEAQLSQRGCALRVVGNFADALKVIENGTINSIDRIRFPIA